MKARGLARCCWCLWGVVGCTVQVPPGDEAAQGCQLSRVTSVPIQVHGNVMLVDASINGQPALMQIDTGAFASGLTPGAVKRLGVYVDDNPAGQAVGIGGKRWLQQAFVSNFSIGDMHGSNMLLIVFGSPHESHPLTMGTFNGRPIDGLLGMDILSHYDLDFDVPGDKIGFYAAPGCDTAATVLPMPVYAVPLNKEPRDYQPAGEASAGHYGVIGHIGGRMPELTITVNGVPLKVGFDSGSRGMLITSAGRQKLGLASVEESTAPHSKINGVGGD
jgi:hypothetical protein